MLLGNTETKLIHFNTSFPCKTQRRSVDITNIRSEVFDLCPNKTKTNSNG
jgi:hypothetical protein